MTLCKPYTFPLRLCAQVLFICLVFSAAPLLAQKVVYTIETIPSGMGSKYKYPGKTIIFKDSAAWINDIEKRIGHAQTNGYFDCSASTSAMNDTVLNAQIQLGRKYTFKAAILSSTSPQLLENAGVKSRQAMSWQEFSGISEKIIRYCENNGYPFASAGLTRISLAGDTVLAQMDVSRGEKYTIDSIRHRGNARISENFLKQYLGIKPTMLYNESAVREIGQKIVNLQFIKETSPAAITFSNGKARILFQLETVKASQFEGIIGFASSKERNGKLELTGNVKLDLLNALGQGESMNLAWKALPGGTQDLRTGFQYPYIFGSPFGIEGKLTLYKKDSTYIDTRQQVGLQYIFGAYRNIKIFYEIRTASVIGKSGQQAFQSGQVIPSGMQLWGLSQHFENLDYRLNPRKGFRIHSDAATGTRKMDENALPAGTDTLGDDMQFYTLQTRADVYLPTFKRVTTLLSVKSGWLPGKNFYQNELFRLGGLSTIRGFDEETLPSSAYSIGTFELHYIFEKNSYLSVFCDAGWLEQKSIGNYKKAFPIGIGAGISFETKAGIFSLYYALGKTEGTSFDLRSAKIHFGITAMF